MCHTVSNVAFAAHAGGKPKTGVLNVASGVIMIKSNLN